MIPTDDPVAVAATDAIHSGDPAALRRLLTEHPWLASARLGEPAAMSRALLHVATDWPGHFPRVAESIRVLVEAGADVDARFRGPPGAPPPSAEEVDLAFWGACHGGRRGSAELLLDRGAALDRVPPWSDQTPLDAAVADGAEDLIAWLRGRGARSADEGSGE